MRHECHVRTSGMCRTSDKAWARLPLVARTYLPCQMYSSILLVPSDNLLHRWRSELSLAASAR